MEILVVIFIIIIFIQRGLLNISGEVRSINITLSFLFGITVFLLTYFFPCFGTMNNLLVVSGAICYKSGLLFAIIHGLIGGAFVYIFLKLFYDYAVNNLIEIFFCVVGLVLLYVIEMIVFGFNPSYIIY